MPHSLFLEVGGGVGAYSGDESRLPQKSSG